MAKKKTKESAVAVKKDWKPIIVYVLMQGASIGAGIFLAIIASIQAYEVNPEEVNVSVDSTALTILSSVLMLAAAVIICVMYRKRIKDDAKRLKPKQWGLLLLATIGLLAINFAITSSFEALGIQMSNQDSIKDSMGQAAIATALMAAVAAPILEEFVFRYSFGTIIKNKMAFIIVSSVIFGLLHGVGVVTILYIILGLFFVMTYLKTDRNIVASIVMHFLNNLIGVIGILMTLGQ